MLGPLTFTDSSYSLTLAGIKSKDARCYTPTAMRVVCRTCPITAELDGVMMVGMPIRTRTTAAANRYRRTDRYRNHIISRRGIVLRFAGILQHCWRGLSWRCLSHQSSQSPTLRLRSHWHDRTSTCTSTRYSYEYEWIFHAHSYTSTNQHGVSCVRTLYVCFPSSPQGFPFQAFLLPQLFSACAVTVIIFGHSYRVIQWTLKIWW